MDVELPNGTVVQGVPDGMSKADLVAKLKANGHDVSGLEAPAPKPAASPLMDIPLVGGFTPRRMLGLVRGGKDIIDTGASYAARGFDKLAGTNEGARVDAMNKAGEADSRDLIGDGADAKVMRVAGQGIATAPIGGVIGQGARMLGAGPRIVNALASNGFTTGAAPAVLLSRAGATDLATRSVAGALTAGASGALIDPEHTGTIAAIGGALPGGAKILGAAGGAVADGAQAAAKGLMQSALKGTIKMHAKGDVDTAVQTLLDYGINPTAGGVEKLKGLIADQNDAIAKAIAGSDAKIDKQKVLNALARSRETFGNQVAPTQDLASIEGIGADFAQSHPDQIPVQLAQKLKQGTDRVLKGKFGEQGSASTEAQKDLRYGLKEGIAEAVPEVSGLNAAESRLLTTLKVAERRALMDVNKNPAPLDVGLALASGHPVAALCLLANSKAAVKGTLAQTLNKVPGATTRLNGLAGPAAFRALPRAEQQQP